MHLQWKQTPPNEKVKNKLLKLQTAVSLNTKTLTCGLYYKSSMILIYDRNDSGQYYKTRIIMVFTILAKAKASLS
jgi:hypothetical protein